MSEVQAPLATCPRCGLRMVQGACTFCGTADRPRSGPLGVAGITPAAPPTPTATRGPAAATAPTPAVAPTPIRRALATVDDKVPLPLVAGGVALTMAIVVALVSAGLVFNLRSQVDDLRQQVHLAQGDVAGIEERADHLNETDDGIEGRLAALESQTDPAAVAAKVQPSVFTIVTPVALGSGFVVSSDGTTSSVVTNYHVIADVWEGGDRHVQVTQENKQYDGVVARVSPSDDLALVTVNVALAPLPQAHNVAQPGAPVLVIGSPLGLGNSVSSGAVSALRVENGLQYIQFSAPVSPGNSGGPVVDGLGNVLGITVAKVVVEGAEGIGFAIPISQLCNKLQVCN